MRYMSHAEKGVNQDPCAAAAFSAPKTRTACSSKFSAYSTHSYGVPQSRNQRPEEKVACWDADQQSGAVI